jgi:hypothetical protein
MQRPWVAMAGFIAVVLVLARASLVDDPFLVHEP